MPNEWLNVFVDQSGNSPASQWVLASTQIQVNNRTVRLHESNRSGVVVLTQGGTTSYGDAEVYLTITFQNGTSRYLSAPLHTTVEVANVAQLELSLLFLTGPAGTPYRALVNGHCVYEVV